LKEEFYIKVGANLSTSFLWYPNINFIVFFVRIHGMLIPVHIES
jgi:hypothetical protein